MKTTFEAAKRIAENQAAATPRDPEPTMVETLAKSMAQALCERITAARYDLWFRDKTKFTLERAGSAPEGADDDDSPGSSHGLPDRLIVGVRNLHYQDWLQQKFADDVRVVATELIGHPVAVSFVIDPVLFQSQRQSARMAAPTGSGEPAATRDSAAEALPAPPSDTRTARPGARAPMRVRRYRRLDGFVVGPCNRVAHAAAVGVVEEPGQTPIPLVIHGPVGSGKSHLLEGIQAGLRDAYKDARILYLTAEEFTNRFLAAMHQNRQPSFRKQFRECDVLLVDDLQFLAKKPATQVEFLHTLETLQRDGRTVVVACDCHPRLADIFQPELTDRLVGGAVHGLAWPDPATRRAMLVAKFGEKAAGHLPDDVADLMVDKLRGNVRELEGALHSLAHLAKVSGRPVSLNLAQEALGDVLKASVRTVALADVDRAVTRVLGLASSSLQSRGRTWQIAGPRMVAMYLARKHTGATYSEVGQHFGQRNHSTVVSAEKKVRLWLADGESMLVGGGKAPVRDVMERIEVELAR